jgi:TetR/AcrR family acrAB operon transcriptional repressor
LIQRVVGQMEVQLDELQTRRHYDDPTEMMRELAFHFLDRMVNNPNFRRIIGICWHKCEYVGEMMKIRDKHIECDRRFLDICMTAFAASRERGFLSPCVDPRIAAIGLKAIIDGLVINWTLAPSTFPLVETGTRIIDSYLAGLRGGQETGDRRSGR